MAKTKRIFGEYKCKICSKVFSERSGLAHHVQLHANSRPFACELCAYTCKTRKYLSKHTARVHTPPKGHECALCGKRFHFKSLLNKHMYTHTDERPYKCEVCNKGFNSKFSLRCHKHLHTGAKPYKCSYCDYACRDNSTLRKHQERHAGVTRLYQCTAAQCDKSYKSKSRLKTHVSTAHMQLDVKTEPCAQCGKMFTTAKRLNNHVRRTHERLYACKCEICGVTLSSRYNMATHLTTHIDYRPFACSFEGCSKRYKDKCSLKKHTIIHYPEKHFECDVCHKKFSRLHRMHEHKRQHRAKKKSVFCDYCGKGFYNKNYIAAHITRKHLYRQPYICDLCGLVTYNKPSLVMHLKHGHASETDRKCKICKKTFKKHMYLKLHYWRTHSIRYKLNKHKARKPKKKKNVIIEETSVLKELELLHDIKVEALSDSEENLIKECVEYSTGVLIEDANGETSGRAASAAEKSLADFFVEHVITPTCAADENRAGDRAKEADVSVDAACQREAERVRAEMLRRWRANNPTVKPFVKLKRFYGSAKRAIVTPKNEKIEITVFSETENNSEVDNNHESRELNHSADNITAKIRDKCETLKVVESKQNCEVNERIAKISLSETDEFIKMANKVTVDKQRNPQDFEGAHYDEASIQNNENKKGDLITADDNQVLIVGEGIKVGKDLEQVENNLKEFSQSNAFESIAYESSLAELVKTNKRKCVRNSKKINYTDPGSDDDEIRNREINIEVSKHELTKNGDLVNKISNNENESNKQKHINNNLKKKVNRKPRKKLSKRITNNNISMKNNGIDKHKAKRIDNSEELLDKDVNLETNLKNDQMNLAENDEINTELGLLEERSEHNTRRSVRILKRKLNEKINSRNKSNDGHNDSGGDDFEDDEDFVPDDETVKGKNQSNKFKINTHQCYVCFKLYETKEKLLDHCKEHFDVCNVKMLKKCPLCDFATKNDLVRHVRIMHKIKLNYLYGTLKDRKNNNEKSRFYFNVTDDAIKEIEVIPSIKNLNRQAFLKIDRERRKNNDKEVKKTKLVKKDGEWIVEKVLINTKNYLLPDKVEELLKNNEKESTSNNSDTENNEKTEEENNKNDNIENCGDESEESADKTENSPQNDEKELTSEEYCGKMRKLYHIAKKKGHKMLFPCNECEKICQTLSALKLHLRRHDPNAKPFAKKVWKHKLTEDQLRQLKENKEKDRTRDKNNKNRYEKPKPIVNKHKCDPKLKDFYEKNIKGADIEFWQFLKIFNKITRENVNDFSDLEKFTAFGNYFYDPAAHQKNGGSSKNSDSNPSRNAGSSKTNDSNQSRNEGSSKTNDSNPSRNEGRSENSYSNLSRNNGGSKIHLKSNLSMFGKSKTNFSLNSNKLISKSIVKKGIGNTIRKDNKFKRSILLSKKEYMERQQKKELLRKKMIKSNTV